MNSKTNFLIFTSLMLSLSVYGFEETLVGPEQQEETNPLVTVVVSGRQRTHTCDVCDKKFTRVDNLILHKRRHSGVKPHKCIFNGCNKTFVTSGKLTLHTRTHTGEKPYACQEPFCGKAFAQSNDLTRHKITHTGEKPYLCTVPGCGQVFAQSAHLTKHIRKHTGEKPYACGTCGKEFSDSSNLAKHTRIHERKRKKDEDQLDDDENDARKKMRIESLLN